MKHIWLFILLFTTKIVWAQDCYTSTIRSPTPFMGNHGEIAKLADGSIWEIQYQYEYMYEYYPTVTACPSRGLLILDKKRLRAKQIAGNAGSSSTGGSVIESYIENEFTGLEMGKIFRLSNGQIWEQTEAWIWIWIWVRPQVMIYNQGGLYKMKVENIEHPVYVRRLK